MTLSLPRTTLSLILISALAAATIVLGTAPAGAEAPEPCGTTGGEAVFTDRESYPQLALVQVGGSGFEPGCSVEVRVIRPDGSIVKGDGTETPGSDTILTDGDGAFEYAYQLNEMDGTYEVRAIGANDAVLASTTFEDAPQVTALKRTSAAGIPTRIFAHGQTVFAEGSVDNNRHWKWFVLKPDSTVVAQSACSTAASTTGNFTVPPFSYAIDPADPLSGAASWRFELRQYGASSRPDPTCAEPAGAVGHAEFWVARATAYKDGALTQPTAFAGPNQVAHMVVEGLRPSVADWEVLWVLPGGATACANNSGTDRPDTMAPGRLPAVSSLNYLPGLIGDAWNLLASYAAPCPTLSTANEGDWGVLLSKSIGSGGGVPHIVALPAFTNDATVPSTTHDVPTGPQPAPFTVTLTPSDSGGSGVDATHYTTDGSAPTTGSPVYDPAAKPVLADGQQIRYFSVDNAGNEESVQSSGVLRVASSRRPPPPAPSRPAPAPSRPAPVSGPPAPVVSGPPAPVVISGPKLLRARASNLRQSARCVRNARLRSRVGGRAMLFAYRLSQDALVSISVQRRKTRLRPRWCPTRIVGNVPGSYNEIQRFTEQGRRGSNLTEIGRARAASRSRRVGGLRVGALRVRAVASQGRNVMSLRAMLKGRRLPPGSYRIVVTPRNQAGTSRSHAIKFWVLGS